MQIDLLGLVLVGIIWGSTNPLLEKGSKDKKADATDVGIKSLLHTVLLNYKFLIPFGINQLGSVLYYYFMGKTDFSLAPMIANSVSFVMTFVVEHLLKREFFKFGDILGLGLVISGIFVCTFS